MADRPFEDVLLACDLDGTLVSPDGTIHPDNHRALSDFLRGGGRFAVATGRTIRSVQRNFPDLASDLPGIFCNGAHIYDRTARRTIHASPLPPRAHAVATGILSRFPDVGLEIFTEHGAVLVRTSAVLRLQLAAEGIPSSTLDLDDVRDEWLKILVGGTPADLVPVRAHLADTLRGELTFVSSDAHLLDLMGPGVSKGAALTWLRGYAERRGRVAIAVAAGDNDNDVEMLRAADFGFVPANATPAAAEAAHRVLPHHGTPILPHILAFLEEWSKEHTKLA